MLGDDQEAEKGAQDLAVDDFAFTEKEQSQFEAEPGVVRTLDGEVAGDELEQDSLNYQILLGKIDNLLDSLKLDA